MTSETSHGSTQETPVYLQLQHLQEEHQDELEGIVRVLATITHIAPEKVKPHIDSLLRELVGKQEERPFHETATAEEWVTAFQGWAASHRHTAPSLSDYAVSRESMYEDERF
jgi:hypothetical protein